MLIALTAAVLSAAQASPPPSTRPPEVHRDVRIVTVGGPGHGGPDRDLDKNGDGFVTREEFTAPQASAFDLLDANRDGRLSTEEFAAGREAARVILGDHGGPGGPGPRVRLDGLGGPEGPAGPGMMRFRRIPGGPDGDDVHVRTLGGPDGPGDLDADKDGKVSEAEFLAPLREAFQRLDADRSGALEEGERGSGEANVFVIRRDGPAAD